MCVEEFERDVRHVGFVEVPNGTKWAKFKPGEARAKTSVLIYLAGAYTKPDPVENTHRMIRIADALLNLGVVPLVPHLTMLWHLLCPRPYAEWLQYDLHVMARCDAVLRVPGHSSGADGEVQVAGRLGQPVIHPKSAAVDDCVSAVKAWLAEVPAWRERRVDR